MIIAEKAMTTNGEYYHYYSDENRYIIVNGIAYGVYWSKHESECTEGEIIEESPEDVDADEALEILLGGAV